VRWPVLWPQLCVWDDTGELTTLELLRKYKEMGDYRRRRRRRRRLKFKG